ACRITPRPARATKRNRRPTRTPRRETAGGYGASERRGYLCQLPVCRSITRGGMIDLLDCTVEALHEDGELILYRAVHASPADGAAPSVLVVGPAGGEVSPPTPACLRHRDGPGGALDPRRARPPRARSPL